MSNNNDFSNDELIIGVCGGIGTNLKFLIATLREQFERFGCDVHEIKLTEEYGNIVTVRQIHHDKLNRL